MKYAFGDKRAILTGGTSDEARLIGEQLLEQGVTVSGVPNYLFKNAVYYFIIIIYVTCVLLMVAQESRATGHHRFEWCLRSITKRISRATHCVCGSGRLIEAPQCPCCF